MAVIGKIREKSGWAIGLIGIAMLGFIATDLLSNRIFHTSNEPKGIGRIFGKDVDPQEFAAKYDAYVRATMQQKKPGEQLTVEDKNKINDEVWQEIVDDKVVEHETKKLGLDVTGTEIYDMIIGPYPDPIAVQNLQDPKTHTINKAGYKHMLENIDDMKPEQREQWDRFEDYLVSQRIKNKFRTLVRAGIYVTDLEMQDDNIAQSRRSTIQFVPLFLSSVPDSTVQISDKEIKDYYDKHKEQYKREDSRTFEYVTFDLKPSAEDSANTKKSIEALTNAFQKTDDDSSFVVTNGSGTYNNRFQGRGGFPENSYLGKREDSIFAHCKDGDMIGPFYEDGSWKIAKVVDHKEDSVYHMRASHILKQLTPGAKDKKADSIAKYNEAKTIYDEVRKPGADFAKIAQEKSDDGSSSKGGDLGWFTEGQMVKPFNDAVLHHNKGDIILVTSQFGTHVIKVTGDKNKKLMKFAILEKPVVVGAETKTKAYNLATNFRTRATDATAFDKTVNEMRLNKKVAQLVKPNQHDIPGLKNPRELIRWAFKDDTKVGSISDAFLLTDEFVVAKMTNIYTDGYAPLDEIKNDVKVLAQHEKKKQMLADRMKEARDKYKTLDEMAKALKSNVSTADGITFQNPNVQNLANEPTVVGATCGLKMNEISQPVIGQNGVYIIKLTNVVDAKLPPNYDKDRKMKIDQEKQRSDGEAKEALHKKADIKDYRYNYY